MTAAGFECLSLLTDIIHAKVPTIPFASSVTGQTLDSFEVLGASYWQQNLVSPVLYNSAMTSIATTLPSPIIVLEIGPHSALAGPIKQIFRNQEKSMKYIPTLIRNSDAKGDLLEAAGNLWLNNVDLDLKSVILPGKFLTDLPQYSWHYENSYWYESRLSEESRLRKFSHHDLLGSRIIESSDLHPSWRNMLHIDNVPWLQDHDIAQQILFPAACYITMAGEAIRQLTNSVDYTVRQVYFQAALVLHKDRPVEINTQIQSTRLTSSLDSSWFDFTVSSFSGGTWTKRCFGQARAGQESQIGVKELSVEPLPRKLPREISYHAMKRIGLNYGPAFRGLSDITAHVSERKAVATILCQEPQTSYAIHPSEIDCAIQLLCVANAFGLQRNYDKLRVPIYLEELFIRPAKNGIVVQAETRPTPGDGLSGDVIGVYEGEVTIYVKDIRLSSLGDKEDVWNGNPHAATELEWKSDPNFIHISELVRPSRQLLDILDPAHLMMEKLALACMVEMAIKLDGLEAKQPYLKNFRTWLQSQNEKALKGYYTHVTNSLQIALLDSPSRMCVIEDLLEQCKSTNLAENATAIYRILTSCAEIFTGSMDPLKILLEDEILTKVYDSTALFDYSQFLNLLGHYKPSLKVLEIGAGIGGVTNTVLNCLMTTYGERLYSTYVYTDPSASALTAAKQRLQGFPGLQYTVLDISKDPTEQGLEAESFDLVVAVNVSLLFSRLKTQAI
jgi:acyl transferase domain-containing protein